LAHVGVANLYGVERDGELTYLVWDYVEGVTLDEYAGSARCGRRERRAAARDLVLAVETLHARGIVHGAVKGSNVIVDSVGRLTLTHVSPLLYTDPAEDQNALLGVLDELAVNDPALAAVIAEADAGEMSLRRLATRLGAVIDAREAEGEDEPDRGEGKAIRRRAMVGACVTAAMAVVLFAGLKLYANQKAPRAPVPPEAPPAAMQPAPQP
jgi:serine/threonine protein kinase